MTELFGNDFIPSGPEISGDLGISHCPYRTPSFAITLPRVILQLEAISQPQQVNSLLQRQQKIAGRESANSQGRAAKPGPCKGSGTARQCYLSCCSQQGYFLA
jgi:coenzyme F420-reducing hydrogenase gamma subunit